jgi:hypothetical protein
VCKTRMALFGSWPEQLEAQQNVLVLYQLVRQFSLLLSNLKQLDKYRATSPLFNVTYPPHNLFGSPAGQTQGIGDGYWVFLQPLSPGKHELHFSGLTPGNPTTGTANFAIDTTYHLIVQ